MFEEFMRKLRGRDESAEEEVTFKDFEESTGNPTAAPKPESTDEGGASIRAKSDSVELKVIRPASYAEVSDVADSLLAGCTVVLNVELLERPVVLRMLDFINGVTYCTDGEIKQVAQSTFIVTPHANVDVSDL